MCSGSRPIDRFDDALNARGHIAIAKSATGVVWSYNSNNIYIWLYIAAGMRTLFTKIKWVGVER